MCNLQSIVTTHCAVTTLFSLCFKPDLFFPVILFLKKIKSPSKMQRILTHYAQKYFSLRVSASICSYKLDFSQVSLSVRKPSGSSSLSPWSPFHLLASVSFTLCFQTFSEDSVHQYISFRLGCIVPLRSELPSENVWLIFKPSPKKESWMCNPCHLLSRKMLIMLNFIQVSLLDLAFSSNQQILENISYM